MDLLLISADNISSHSELIVIIMIVAGILSILFFMFKDAIMKFNERHNFIQCSDSEVNPVSWQAEKDGEEGISMDGVPYYSVKHGSCSCHKNHA